MDYCNTVVAEGKYLSESCGRRFVKDEGSSTGYIQCVWKGAPRNSCDMWSGEDVRSAKECEAPQTNGKPTCAHGLGRDGNGGAWQKSTPTPDQGTQCSSTCCCPSGSTIQVSSGTWRCT